MFNLLLIVAVVAVAALLVRAETERRSAQKELESTASQLEELRQSTQNSGQKVAEEVLNKVRQHIDVPNDPAPTVATITDVEKLQANNDFYKAAKNGDNLIITEKRAILYDAQRDIVLDVVPVRVTQTASPTPGTQTPASTPVGGAPDTNANSEVTPSP